MTIVYVNVCRARDAAVLCEATNADLRSTNVAQVTTQLLEHLRDHPGSIQEGECRTFIQRNQKETDFFSNFVESCYSVMEDLEALRDDHYFHLFLKDGVYYVCLGDDPDMRDQKVNFFFLQHVQEDFVKLFRFNRINTARAYSLDSTFGSTLQSAMHYHNLNHKELAADAKVQAIQSKVENLQNIMGRNISLVLDNQQRMEKLLHTSEVMREDALVFRKKSRVMRKHGQRKNWCITVCIIVMVVAGIFLAALGACGTGFRYCRAATAADDNEDSTYDGGEAYSGGGDDANGGEGDNQQDGGEGDNQQNGEGGGGGRRRRRILAK
ncbi:hypothetical protein MPSEU_000705100 [Mayamaea pseudoterrestris]|nr:hypothetical protein MPSEU_000705100 [Mayamaea pseudoterrestris]